MDSLPPNMHGWTLERHILEEQRTHPDATGEFTRLFQQLALAGKIIGSRVNQAGLAGVLGVTGEVNVQGERVQKLDVFANQALIHSLEAGGQAVFLQCKCNPNGWQFF
jgi:fructose-1,6-bisphosphatase I